MTVFTKADVRELNPERGREANGPLRERPLLLLGYMVSPRETRGRFCGGTSLPHEKKEICASRPRPNPSETKTRPTSSEEATSIYCGIYYVCFAHDNVGFLPGIPSLTKGPTPIVPTTTQQCFSSSQATQLSTPVVPV